MLYGSELWTMNQQRANRLTTVEMDFWRRAARRTIMDEIEHRRLTWYGHLRRMKDGRIPKAVHTWKIERRNRRGRPRATWDYNVQQATRKFGVTDQDTEEREQWRNLIKENL